MGYPTTRLRRLRSNPVLRSMVQETSLRPRDFIFPLFVCEGSGVTSPVESMPGVSRLSVDRCVEECRRLHTLGIGAVLLFGKSEKKDATGLCGADDDGIVQRAIRAIKAEVAEMMIITDVCNCGYTTHGHCGSVVNGKIDNDVSLESLTLQAVSHAKAGCDMVAPSDMMDGRVGAIRAALDNCGFAELPIMSYAVKYASAFYGPFRDAAGSAPQFGDRRTYQMDMANGEEALREVELDLAEGADIIMVKPALSYLDIIHRVKTTFRVPVAAYNVSGEYAMVKAAAERGWVENDCIMIEILTAIKRAGASMIITYHAAEAAAILREAYSR
jgi:porphobilinogen synthase